MPELDQDVRLALFAHIDRLRQATGGLISAALLNEGMLFRGQRVAVWNQPRGIFKPAILGKDGAALSIHTSFESPYDDSTAADGNRFVYRYQGKDPNKSDNRAVRRAFERQLPLLYLVGVQPGVYTAEFPFYVVADRPEDLSFELMTDVQGDLSRFFSRDPLENEALKAYATRIVRQRLHQQRFRYLVLSAYREQCAMCQLRHSVLLDAAHIIEDRDDRGLPEVPNGLSLCTIHHTAYDAGIIGVDPDYKLHLRGDVLKEADGPMLRHGLQALHGLFISLPRSPAKHPNREYLAERFQRFRAA